MKMMRGTVYTMRPFAFARSGFGESVAYLVDEAVYLMLILQLPRQVNVKRTSKTTIKFTLSRSNVFKGPHEGRCGYDLLFLVNDKSSLVVQLEHIHHSRCTMTMYLCSFDRLTKRI